MTEQLSEGNGNPGITIVSRVMPRPVKKVWATMLTPGGQSALLGEGAVLGNKGDNWRAATGAWGVVRSYHPLEEIRFSWHADENAPRTWVDVVFTPQDSDTTKLEVRHDHKGVEIDTDTLTRHWTTALEHIESDALS